MLFGLNLSALAIAHEQMQKQYPEKILRVKPVAACAARRCAEQISAGRRQIAARRN